MFLNESLRCFYFVAKDENGRWNGIIGVLQRHEADLSVSAVTITYSRVSVIDFTLPFMHLGIAILMRRNMADEAAERSGGSNLFTFMVKIGGLKICLFYIYHISYNIAPPP